MNLLDKIVEKLIDSPGKTLGKVIADQTDGENLVDGKQTWELAKDRKHDLDAMKKCCDAELSTYKKTGLIPAPYYFERVAILSRKEKNYTQEIKYCEKYIKVAEEYCRNNGLSGNEYAKMSPDHPICKRLQKAKELLAESNI